MRLEFVSQQGEEKAVQKDPGQDEQGAGEGPQGHQGPRQVEQQNEQQGAVAGQGPQAEARVPAALQGPAHHWALGEPSGAGWPCQVMATQTPEEVRPRTQRIHMASKLQEGGIQYVNLEVHITVY